MFGLCLEVIVYYGSYPAIIICYYHFTVVGSNGPDDSAEVGHPFVDFIRSVSILFVGIIEGTCELTANYIPVDPGVWLFASIHSQDNRIGLTI